MVKTFHQKEQIKFKSLLILFIVFHQVCSDRIQFFLCLLQSHLSISINFKFIQDCLNWISWVFHRIKNLHLCVKVPAFSLGVYWHTWRDHTEINKWSLNLGFWQFLWESSLGGFCPFLFVHINIIELYTKRDKDYKINVFTFEV